VPKPLDTCVVTTNDYQGADETQINWFGKRSFPGVAWPPDAKPARSGAAGKDLDQNRAKTLHREAVRFYMTSWNWRVKTQIPDYIEIRGGS
jgi:hypothetical protein